MNNELKTMCREAIMISVMFTKFYCFYKTKSYIWGCCHNLWALWQPIWKKTSRILWNKP